MLHQPSYSLARVKLDAGGLLLLKAPIIFVLRSTLSIINCLANSTYCLPNRLNKTAKLAITATPIPAPPRIVGVTTVIRSSLL